MNDERLKVGLFVGDLADDFSRGVCKGTMQAAEELDVNLLIFPGKYFDRDYQMWDGIKYEYQHNTLFTYVFPEEIDLLIIAIGSIGYLSTEKRRKEFLNYFNQVPILTIAENMDGYEYVLYDNTEGVKSTVEYLIRQGRKRFGYLAGYQNNSDAVERMQGYRMALEEHGIPVEERLIEYCNLTRLSRPAAEALLDRNPDMDAIVCVNDEAAYGLYEVLKERNIVIGRDIAVAGFDDLSYAYKLDPPLATVRADSSALGHQALTEGVRYVRDQKPVNHRVSVKFIPRASAKEGLVNTEMGPQLFDTSVERILSENHAMNMIARDLFNFEKFAEQDYAMLLERLYMLEIENCFLYLFPSPMIHLPEENWVPPKEILLKACLCDRKVITIPRHSQRYPVEQLYSHAYMPQNRRFTMILMDLFTTDTQHGLVLMELRFDKHYYLESLAYQMSAAVHRLQLMQAQEETQKQLEDSLRQLEMHNIQLDNAAKMDELTSVLNRRGFEQCAEAVLKDEKQQGKYLLAAYADMDNLKIVNDRFGHKEGDFALQSIARMLRMIFRKEDLIGRIGGDEFAILALRDQPVDLDMLRKTAAECMTAFNEECEKPYYIRMTIGGYTQAFAPDCRLSELLEDADDDLYEAKKQRTKDILKP